jgi:predicted signal transduction protein with EAL and GGDEF domain
VKIHEYQGKAVLASNGVPVPKGKVAYSVDDAVKAAKELGFPVVVKAQIHAGGRGKAGGVKLASSADEAERVASAILEMDIKGIPVRKVLIAEAADIAREFYMSAVLDRAERRILEEEGLAPKQLQFEITESMVMVDADRAEGVLVELAGMGIGLAIDDFGTGYSSLAYLRRLPVRELKIDRSFVQRLGFDDEDAAIVRATIDLGHSLGLAVVAEGVEDARALKRLRELRCDSVQGFYLCRPQAAEDVVATLDKLHRSFEAPALTG